MRKKLNLAEVHCIDDMSTREDNPGMGNIFNYSEQYPDLLKELNVYTAHDNDEKDMSYLEYIKYDYVYNRKTATYLHARLSKVGVNDNLYGAIWLEWWYRRNLIIAGRLATLADRNERVLMIVGFSHVDILETILKDMKMYEIVDAMDYL